MLCSSGVAQRVEHVCFILPPPPKPQDPDTITTTATLLNNRHMHQAWSGCCSAALAMMFSTCWPAASPACCSCALATATALAGPWKQLNQQPQPWLTVRLPPQRLLPLSRWARSHHRLCAATSCAPQPRVLTHSAAVCHLTLQPVMHVTPAPALPSSCHLHCCAGIKCAVRRCVCGAEAACSVHCKWGFTARRS
jgi:hypothetical protein